MPTAELIARLRAQVGEGGDDLHELVTELEDRGEEGSVPRDLVRQLIRAAPPDCWNGAALMAAWDSPSLLAEIEAALANPARRSALRVAPRLALAFRERGDLVPSALGEAGLPLAARLARDPALPEEAQRSIGVFFALQGRLRDLLARSPTAGRLEGATRALHREECERWLPSLAADLPELARRVDDADLVASLVDAALTAARGDLAREILVDGRVPLSFRKKAVVALFPGSFGAGVVYDAEAMPATAGPARDVVLALLGDADAPASIRTEILSRTALDDEEVLDAVRKIAREDPSPWLRAAAKERLTGR